MKTYVNVKELYDYFMNVHQPKTANTILAIASKDKRPYCINCDEKVGFDTHETDDGYIYAYCMRCGCDVYIGELNDFNARLREIRKARI